MLKLFRMSTNIKQVYVALQLYENEIDILIGEYYNTRFNIIRADKYTSNAISDFSINNRDELIKDIRKAIQTSAEKIGTAIEKLLLVIPAYNFKRFPLILEGGFIEIASNTTLFNKLVEMRFVASA